MVVLTSVSGEAVGMNGFHGDPVGTDSSTTSKLLKPFGVKLEVCNSPRTDLEGDYLELQREYNDHSVFIKTGPGSGSKYIYFHAEYKYGWVIDSSLESGRPMAYLGGLPSSRLPEDPSNKLPHTFWRVLKGSMGIFNMDYAMKINRVWSGSAENSVMSAVTSPIEDVHAEVRETNAHAEVRETIELGFSKLKEWLDMRLQLQEELLQSVSHDCKTLDGRLQEANRGHDDAKELDKESVCSSSDAAAKAGQVDLTAASAPIEPTDADDNVSIEVMPLPGSPLEANADSQFQTHSAFCAYEPRESSKERTSSKKSNTSRNSKRSQRVTNNAENQPLRVSQPQDWQSKLMDVFDQLDRDGSGAIDTEEFMQAFTAAGMPDLAAFDMFRAMDEEGNDQINRVEWLHLIEEASRGEDHEIKLITDFLERLANLQDNRGHIYGSGVSGKSRHCLILRHDSPIRMAWDLFLCIMLLYVSLSVPFSLGFGQSDILNRIDLVTDILFCCDVILNFRTTYLDKEECIVVDGQKIACKYLSSWFLLDFCSSVPFDLITGGLLPNLTPVRLLKIGKIGKVMKLLRLSKIVVVGESEFMEAVEQFIISRAYQTCARILKLVWLAFLAAHWLACFGNAIDNSSLDVYFVNEAPTELQKYLAGIYWAMTTLSTVGYGDITPKSDEERAYAMVAMAVGGTLYGYVIGSVTSIVTDMDVSTNAYHERMEMVVAWLDGNEQIPPELRRRVRKHFKRSLATKSVMEDSAVVTELSPELRADTAFFLVHEHVKRHPMFSNIPNSTLAKLVEVLQKTHASTHERVVRVGDPGIAMYILVQGVARYEQGTVWLPPDLELPRAATRFAQVAPGDSFGEEILFGLAESYTYTIITLTSCEFHSISEDDFQDNYENMPELRQQMYAAFLKSRELHAGLQKKSFESAEGRLSGSIDQLAGQEYHSIVPHTVPAKED